MNERIRLHEIVSGKYLQHETWWVLEKNANGRKSVVEEHYANIPFRKKQTMRARRLSVNEALACGGVLAQKLRSALDRN